ncbi:hypothetical protein JW977_02625 [Candidatus Falkowbacteria bacterium]|nr:hypothetical protein [Candidatus Falkowbacteria bacterium]
MNKKIMFLVLFLVIVLTGCGITNSMTKNLTPDEAQAKALSFINNNLVEPGSEVTIDSVTEENGLYKVVVKLSSGQTVDSFITKDGTKFFPQVMDIAEIEKSNNPVATEVPKNDKPVVEVFVMSHCPYGTQIEKGLLPVVEALGDKADIEVKFCDYAMHGEAEINEELTQVCIKKVAPGNYFTYLKCFLKEGKSSDCLKEINIDQGKLSSCISETDNQFSVTKNFKDQSTWLSGQFPLFDVYKADNEKYGVQGSPTIVINGVQAESGRDSASLLATICSAFNTLPNECTVQLPNETPSAGFGFSTSATSTTASCGG